MLLISSHVLDCHEIDIPSNAVIRINLAWVNSLRGLSDKISLSYSTNVVHDIFLDNPTDRKKPPNNQYKLDDIRDLILEYDCIKYFAISNVESANDLSLFYEVLPRDVILVPKIETIKGVQNIENIIKGLQHRRKYIMLDHDDLCSDLIRYDKDIKCLYTDYINPMIDVCKLFLCKVLRTQGVIFSTEI